MSDVDDLGPECDHEPRVGGACHGCAADHYRRRADQLADRLASVRRLCETGIEEARKVRKRAVGYPYARAEERVSVYREVLGALGSAEAGAPKRRSENPAHVPFCDGSCEAGEYMCPKPSEPKDD